ncbi:MAG: ABC transporter substrate-binding protein [Actinomycetota bacterium]
MTRKTKAARWGVALTCFALTMTACGDEESGSGAGSANAGLTQIVNPSDASGGTVRYLSTDEFASIDPGNTYYAYAWNLSRLYARTLMTYKDVPGPEGTVPVPDLAQDNGQVSADGKTWTYKLRSGLKYEDGTPITSKDIKYAVSRSNYAPEALSNSPTYFKKLMGTEYKGPYKDEKLGLASIETPDDTTIVFKLATPFSEFDHLAASPQTAPVPPDKDTGADYENNVVSSGPYKIETYERSKFLRLVKNPAWSPVTDPNRKQRADAIEITLKVEANDLDNRLLAGDAEIHLDGAGVETAAKAKILGDPAKKAQSDNPANGFLRYVALNTKQPPLDNVDCRKAVLYAADHVALQGAYGGPINGDIATTIMPPTIPGYQKTDVYNFLGTPNGDVTKAKEALTACGKPDGFTTVISARADRPKEVAGATALQQSLEKVGIKTTIQTYPSSKYFENFAGAPDFANSKGLGLMFMGWAADWPAGYGLLNQITDGRAIDESGNSNLSQLDNPEINQLFDDSLTITDPAQRNAIWPQIDQKVMEQAAILPIIYERTLLYRSPKASNVFVHPVYGMYSYTSIGINEQR